MKHVRSGCAPLPGIGPRRFRTPKMRSHANLRERRLGEVRRTTLLKGVSQLDKHHIDTAMSLPQSPFRARKVGSEASRSDFSKPSTLYQTPSRNCLVNGETLLKRCILAMTRSAKWARTALSGTCRAFFGAYRGFAKQSLETVWKLRLGSITGSYESAERGERAPFLGAWRYQKTRDPTRTATSQTVSLDGVL